MAGTLSRRYCKCSHSHAAASLPPSKLTIELVFIYFPLPRFHLTPLEWGWETGQSSDPCRLWLCFISYYLGACKSYIAFVLVLCTQTCAEMLFVLSGFFLSPILSCYV